MTSAQKGVSTDSVPFWGSVEQGVYFLYWGPLLHETVSEKGLNFGNLHFPPDGESLAKLFWEIVPWIVA